MQDEKSPMEPTKLPQHPEFEDTDGVAQQKPKTTRFEYDRHITPAARALRFYAKLETWIRVVPKMKQSKYQGWMLPFDVYRFPVKVNGKDSNVVIAHPKVKDPSQNMCLIDQVRFHLSKSRPDWIKTKANPDGFASFRPTSVVAMNVLAYIPGEKEGDKPTLQYRVWIPSFNDGEFGRKGIGYELMQASDKFENSVAHSKHGRMIKITPFMDGGFRDHKFTIGNEKSINEMMFELEQEEIDGIMPLEDIVRKPSALEMSLAIRDCIGMTNWSKLVQEMALPTE